jgi:HAD superfamily phosphoserine phosphatase-like hydrolase
LDGTITKQEVLPVIAAELGISEEIGFLTQMTIRGQIPFEMSFRLRCRLLSELPVELVSDVVNAVPIDEPIVRFIQSKPDKCFVITGNLNVWVDKLAARIGCKLFSSSAKIKPDGRLGELTSILRKSAPIKSLKDEFERIVVIGEGFNDLPMFEEADIGVAYGGVHRPATEVIENSHYIVQTGESLCRLLNTL